jgi:hypothetical protein
MDTTTEALTDTAPLGAVSEQYASTLMTAVIRAGAPGRVIRGHYPPGTEAAQEGLHARWYFVGLHLHGQDLHIFCVPTSQGVLLMIEARGGHAVPSHLGCTRCHLRRRRLGRGPRDQLPEQSAITSPIAGIAGIPTLAIPAP